MVEVYGCSWVLVDAGRVCFLRNRLLWCHWCVLVRVAGLAFGVDRERLRTLRRVYWHMAFLLVFLIKMWGFLDKNVV